MTSISNPYLSQRFRSLIWSCLDVDLVKTATFYAERYFFVDQENHEARHLYATSLLRSGQTQSALYLVDLPQESRCSVCVELYVQCCNKLGRYRQGREALEACLNSGGPSDLGGIVKHFRLLTVCGSKLFLKQFPCQENRQSWRTKLPYGVVLVLLL